MPLTPIAGSTRLRQFQLGIETTFGTNVAATRRMPWTATPDINPNWTFPTADTGTLDQAIAPSRRALDLTIAATGELYSNDVPTIISAGVQGGLSLSGATAKTLTTSVASTSQDVFDTYTGEWGDDSTDVWQLGGGVINDFSLEYPQDLGPINLTANWRFANLGTYPATFTGSLNVDTSPVPLYAADTDFYINDSAGNIEITKLSNIAYGATFAVNNNLDIKRFANGSNTRFQVANYGRGLRTVTFSLIGAKGSTWVAEALKWIGSSPTERFFGIKTNSTVLITGSTYHTLDIRMPGYWLTRSEQAVNSNTAFQLSAQNINDTTLGYPFKMVSVSTRSAL